MKDATTGNTTPERGRLIKICGITTADAARNAAAAGASAIGLNFYRPSPRYIDLKLAREIALALPSEVLRVGIFVNPAIGELQRYALEVPLDVVQIHGIYPASNTGLRAWRAVTMDGPFQAPEDSDDAEAFLLDAPASDFGGSGRTFEWSQARSISRRIIVAGGLSSLNVAAAIAATRPWGVDACSRLELAPGKKDVEKMRAFVAAARRAFEALDSAAESGTAGHREGNAA